MKEGSWFVRPAVWQRTVIGLTLGFAVAFGWTLVMANAEDKTPSDVSSPTVKSPDRILRPIHAGDKPRLIVVPPGVTKVPLRLSDRYALYSLTLTATDANELHERALLTVFLVMDGKVIVTKPLHLADPDLFVVFRTEKSNADAALFFDRQEDEGAVRFRITVLPMNVTQANDLVQIEAEPNDSWQKAQLVPLGATVVGSADDRPYFIAPDQDEAKALSAGVDWFKVEQPDSQPKLVFFNLDILDRDVPANILVYTLNEKGELVPYTEGYDPVSGPHEAQVAPTIRLNGVELNSANKFTTRVLKKGTYFVKVEANHPAYRLRMTVYDLPPYWNGDDTADPRKLADAARKAIVTAMNYAIAAGDSWFANTPRSGAVARRDRQVHVETVVCTACHPSQFSSRGTMWANRNGYPIREREAMRFLAERLHNAPRPFYLEGTAWVRFIGASAHVLSQISLVLREYERLTGESRPEFFIPNAAYVRSFYQRESLPPNGTGNDEQNPPTLSSYETAWMARRLLLSVGDEKTAKHVEKLATSAGDDSIKTVDDLCWQTVFLSEVDREKFADRIKANVERLKKLQRSDGSWAYRLDDKAPSTEFSTGTALFALAKAGLSVDDPTVRKGVEFLLKRQKPFGAWSTDGQPQEAFNTPFKETQLALMALSELFPNRSMSSVPHPASGWTNGEQPTSLRTSTVDATLTDINAIWDPPTPTVLKQLRKLAKAQEPLIRWEAINALCRLADAESVGIFYQALGDDTLMVRRAAAQALREIISRRPNTKAAQEAVAALDKAMQSPDVKVRRAALRVVHQHFRWLVRYLALTNRVLSIARYDPDPIARMQAVQALPQWWVWNDNFAVRARILDTVLDSMAEETANPRVLWALREALYNIFDEDIQYVYNFWSPLLPREDDRKAAVAYFERLMALQASKIVKALEKGTPFQRKQILTALTEFPIVRGWNPHDQIERNFFRIGNDLDAIDFRGAAADIMEPTILRLLHDPNPFVRQRALVLTSYLRSSGGRPRIANAIVKLIADDDNDTRLLAQQAHRLFPFNDQHVQYGIDPRHYPDEPNWNDETIPMLMRLLDNPSGEVKASALRILAEFGVKLRQNETIAEKVKQLAATGDAQVKAAAFDIARHLSSLHTDAMFQATVVDALKLPDTGNPARRAAVRLALTVNEIGHVEAVSKALDRLLQSQRPEDIADILTLARSDLAIRDDVRLVPLYENALTLDSDLRPQVLSLLRQSKVQSSNPALRVALQAIVQSSDDGHKSLAEQILKGQTGLKGDPERLLDFEYFAVRVQPLLAVVGGDGRSCFSCHANQSVFNLRPPDANGQFPNDVSRHNFRSILRVIDLENPDNSLVLKKPTMEVPHCGGKRWDSKEHPAFQAILMWLNGAKVKQGEALGKQDNY